jgi:hypothetical protein
MNLSFLFSETYSDQPGRFRSAHPDWALGDGDRLSLDDPVDLEAGVLAEMSDPADRRRHVGSSTENNIAMPQASQTRGLFFFDLIDQSRQTYATWTLGLDRNR